tara:strand:- start:1092 stop:1574 length:483 start_codon:yes stop_codon:yes gene_type:complete
MFGISTIIKLVLVLLIIGSLLAAGWYVTSMREQLAISKNNNEKYEQAVLDQQLLIRQIKEDVQSIQKANEELAEVVKNQNKDLNSLQEKFNKRKADGTVRDIGKLAVRKPKSVEKIINNASKKAIRCLEIASGAPLTDEEINGKPNSECPSLVSRILTTQ